MKKVICYTGGKALGNPGLAAIGVYWLENDDRGTDPEIIFKLVVTALPVIYRGLILRGCM